ncbi:MAG: sulfatase [Phycisphaeraceae bacterium]
MFNRSPLFTLLLLCTLPLAAAQAADRPPNFVFFLVDDLGYMDVSPNNPNTFYDTPNIDKFAKTAMRFTDGYAACCVCSPTRASILTGKYPARLHTTDYFCGKRTGKLLPPDYLCHLPLEEETIAETLKKKGYATYFAGKWHLGEADYYPEKQGFDINMGGLDRGGPYGGDKYFSPYGNPKLPDGPKGEHLPARLGNETAKFIEANKDKPFLAYLSFYSVHTPLIGRPDLIEKYRQRAAKLPEREKWGKEHQRDVRLVQDVPVYAAMVEAMDLAVGTVLDKLDELKLADNTVVIFFSDNGGLSTSEGFPTSNLPLRAGKGWNYEGGIREPLIIRAPGLTKPGSTCSVPVISTDFNPTLRELAGAPMDVKQHIDGVSLVPLLRGEKDLKRDAIYWHYPHYGNQGGSPSGAIRSGKYKLIQFYEDDRVELYDLENDLSEKNDLSKEKPQVAAELQAKLQAWLKDVKAQMPTPNPKFSEEAERKFHENANKQKVK